MTKNQKVCLFLSGFLFLIFSGSAVADKTLVDKKYLLPDKAQIEKNLLNQSGIVFPWEEEFSMHIIKPFPNIDCEIIKNTFNFNTDFELRIIDPYTKKETTGRKEPCLGPLQNNLNRSRTDEKYSMVIIRPDPNIDPGIVVNMYNPDIDYKLRVINPYTKNEMNCYKGRYLGPFQNKLQQEENRYETPITGYTVETEKGSYIILQ